MKILNYDKWKKRSLLVIKMLTTSDILEASLTLLEIPFIVYDMKEDFDIESAWQKDKHSICGIIISGSRTNPATAMPSFPDDIIENFPVLGICYGHEILGSLLGCKIVDCNLPFGENSAVIIDLLADELFNGIDTKKDCIVNMHHDQMLESLPEGSKLIAKTDLTPVAGFHHKEKKWWGIQFHPEKDLTGETIFKNFYEICRL
jgi:GMP synthase-like glutamine amidotransferase